LGESRSLFSSEKTNTFRDVGARPGATFDISFRQQLIVCLQDHIARWEKKLDIPSLFCAILA
jgi:hypothetical protein